MKNPIFSIIKFAAWAVFPKFKLEGTENLPDEPVVLIGNHSQAYGPVALQLYTARQTFTWCISQMMDMKEVPEYAYGDFWSQKPKNVRWLFKIASYIIAPIGSFIMRHADTIPVYRDKRVMKTFGFSVDKLMEGADVAIFPECYDKYNNIVYDFQRGFVNLARMYYKKTRKSLPFVPMYICPKLKKIVLGAPVYYDTQANPKEEEERICIALMDAISEIAYDLPPHRVVPYANISKDLYPTNERP